MGKIDKPQNQADKAKAAKDRNGPKQAPTGSGNRMKHNIYTRAGDKDTTATAKAKAKRHITKTYDYTDEKGKLLFQVCRYEPKDFRQRRPGDKDEWIWNVPGNLKVLYRLDDWIASSKQDWQIITEGEKCSDTLRGLGFSATTNPGGALKWKPEYNHYCEGRLVAIICHRDEAGERHGMQIARSLHGITKETRLIFLDPDLPKGSDTTDLVEKDGWTAKEFIDLIEKTPAYIPKETGSQVVSRRLSDIEPVPVQWLWLNRFAQGKLGLLVGNPGVGKSFASLDIAAKVSTGAEWPDGDNLPDGSNRAPKGSVLILTAEDGLADTVRPRLDKMEADCSRIFAIEGVHIEPDDEELRSWGDGKVPVTDAFDLSRDIELLEKKVIEIGDVKLIIIDPLSAYYGTRIDTHKNASIRAVLAPLAGLAERYNVCVIGISHLRKSMSEAAIYRVTGSIGQTAAARVAWLVHVDKENQDRRLLLCLKNNLAREKTGLSFKIVDGRVEYEQGTVTDTADELFQDASEHGPSVQEAIEFLDDIFVDDPTPKAAEVEKKARKAGIPKITLKRAKAACNITSVRHPSGYWRWERPEQATGEKSEANAT
ncbi:hypothetical protein ES705_13541 [subsurface metagenome]